MYIYVLVKIARLLIYQTKERMIIRPSILLTCSFFLSISRRINGDNNEREEEEEEEEGEDIHLCEKYVQINHAHIF
jgi:hypothetical protein